jgi:hypothetical protein
LIRVRSSNADVLFPYLITDDLLEVPGGKPRRYVIDFQGKDVLNAGTFGEPFERVQSTVLSARKVAFASEESRNAEALSINSKSKVNHHHRNFLNRWWQLSYAREDLIGLLQSIPRYIVCGRVTKRPIFEFISNQIRPGDALSVFPLADDYSFGILQSTVHWDWFVAKCSTLTERPRYTSETVFDTFAWPQRPTLQEVEKVASAAHQLRFVRRGLMSDNRISLRDLYRSLELPGSHPLKDAQAKLDKTVRAAYGMAEGESILPYLLNLNLFVSEREEKNELVVGPGLPPCAHRPEEFITDDCVSDEQ